MAAESGAPAASLVEAAYDYQSSSSSSDFLADEGNAFHHEQALVDGSKTDEVDEANKIPDSKVPFGARRSAKIDEQNDVAENSIGAADVTRECLEVRNGYPQQSKAQKGTQNLSTETRDAASRNQKVFPRKKRRRGNQGDVSLAFEGIEQLPEEVFRDLAQSGATAISFVDVDARASAVEPVSDADRNAARGGAALRSLSKEQPVSRAKKRTHHITTLAADAVASMAARNAEKKRPG